VPTDTLRALRPIVDRCYFRAMTIEPRLLDLVTQRNVAVLATIKRDGRPQLSNISYCFDRSRLLVRISLTDSRAKVANLRRDPRASMLVQSREGWTWITLDGDVELTAPAATVDDATVEELIDVYRAISGEHPDWDDYRRAMVADKRLVARFTVTHSYGYTGE
jgi:PPOX class probable F420-dependent enzyme